MQDSTQKDKTMLSQLAAQKGITDIKYSMNVKYSEWNGSIFLENKQK
jgi:hypothetical protein